METKPPPATASSEAMAIDQMPAIPKRSTFHRRAHSDTSFRLPNLDELLLFDPSDLDLSNLPSPAPASQLEPSPRSSDESSGAVGAAARLFPSSSHGRSLSMDSDFFDGLGFGEAAVGEKRGSFDGDGGLDGIKKAMAPDRLAELALLDPKRAKRILTNRQSAARSKERKVRYTGELERKVQTLQTEATTLSAQVTLLQRDTTGLTSENKELKLRLQAMEQQAQLREALNEKLKEEVQRLKIASRQIQSVNGNPFARGLHPQFAAQQTAHHHFGTHQTQSHVPRSSTNNGQPSHVSFLDY